MDSLIKQIMSEIFSISIENIDSHSSMDNIPSWDSLGHLQLLLQLEEKFSISFNERDTISMISFEEIKKVLVDKISTEL